MKTNKQSYDDGVRDATNTLCIMAIIVMFIWWAFT